jgi:phthalate 4,5-dioxygenase oxygenase subunit
MNREMAETLVRTGPGTRMGNLMRRYWVPILLSREIADPDGPQVRVQILGEKLLAFRDTEGQVGLIGEFCSHRGASLFFGRNEEGGIRCAYHGLKFARDGRCVDVPSAPQACKTMGIKAYPCIERAGIVWAYLGPKEKQPAPPEVEWCSLPKSHVFVSKRLQECNYLQAMEGGIDTSHVSYVHRYEVDDDPMHQGTKANDYIKADGNVIFEIENTPFGLTLYGRRNGEPDSYYWRVTQWLFPWFTLIPPFGDHALGGHV